MPPSLWEGMRKSHDINFGSTILGRRRRMKNRSGGKQTDRVVKFFPSSIVIHHDDDDEKKLISKTLRSNFAVVENDKNITEYSLKNFSHFKDIKNNFDYFTSLIFNIWVQRANLKRKFQSRPQFWPSISVLLPSERKKRKKVLFTAQNRARAKRRKTWDSFQTLSWS